MFYEIVRKLPDGAQIVLEGTGDRAVAGGARRPLALHFADAAGGADFPDLAAGDMTHKFAASKAADLQAADRQDPVRDLDRGDALLPLPQRHLSAPAGTNKSPTLRAVATDGHRSGAGRAGIAGRAPPAWPALSYRARPWAKCSA